MGRLQPDAVFDSVCRITPELLRENGIKALLLDLDSTLQSAKSSELPEESVRWVKEMKDAGFVVMLLSNNRREHRVKKACDVLGVSYIHRAHKPGTKGYAKAARTLGLLPREIAMVGDQIYTDVFGANRSGMFSILVESLDLRLIYVRLRRLFENPVIRRAKKRQEENGR